MKQFRNEYEMVNYFDGLSKYDNFKKSTNEEKLN